MNSFLACSHFLHHTAGLQIHIQCHSCHIMQHNMSSVKLFAYHAQTCGADILPYHAMAQCYMDQDLYMMLQVMSAVEISAHRSTTLQVLKVVVQRV
jgi:hypothetical protein